MITEMRVLALGVCALAAVPNVAMADSTAESKAAAMRTKAQGFAAQGRYSEAIDAFKAADMLDPNPIDACSISLAYARRELWPQTELWLDRCHAEGKAGAAPDWVSELERLLSDRIASLGIAPVTIRVEPATAVAKVTVSDFALDESFAPRTIHLARGRHSVVAVAPGYEATEVPIVIEDGKPRELVVRIYEPGKNPDKQQRDDGKTLLFGGAFAAGAGVITYGVMAVGWLKLNSNMGFGGGYETMYKVGRISSLSLFAVSAGLLSVYYYKHRHKPADAHVGAAVLPEGGALVGLSWER
jgi:hypothetical protein